MLRGHAGRLEKLKCLNERGGAKIGGYYVLFTSTSWGILYSALPSASLVLLD